LANRPENPNTQKGKCVMTERTRQEHLQWCKERASEYVKTGDLAGAVGSMTSDMQKHPETAIEGPTAGILMMAGMMDVQSGNASGVQRWIDGFN
jgi:hypothetical protein